MATQNARNAVLMAVIFGPILAWGAVVVATQDIHEALLCAAGVASLALCLLPGVLANRRVDLFHPCFLAGISVALGTTARSFYLCLYDSQGVQRLLLGDRAGDLLTGGVVIALGMLAFATGYCLVGGFQLRSRLATWGVAREFNRRRLSVLTILVVIVVAVLTVDMLRRTGGGAFDSIHSVSKKRKAELSSSGGAQKYASLGYHKLACYTLPSAVYLSWLAIWATGPRDRKTLGIVIAVGILTCVYPFVTSSRIGVVYVILNTAILLYATRRVGVRSVFLAGVACVACLMIMKAIRHDPSHRGGTDGELTVVDTLLGQRNLCGVVKTSNIYEAFGQRCDYYYGTTLFRWLAAPIPREMWPAKPAVTIGYELTEQLYGRETNKGGGTPPGFIGEMLINFGIFGVPIGCFLLGAIIAVFYNTFRPMVDTSAVCLVLYVTLLLPIGFHMITGEVSRNVITMGTSLACAAVVFILTTIRLPPTGYHSTNLRRLLS